MQHNLWMVTRIHSACKLCYYVHTSDHNLRPMFFLTMPWNTTCGWWLGFTQRVSYAIVYTPMIIIWDPCFFQLWNTINFGGCWLQFNQTVSCAVVYTPMIIICDLCSFQLYLETQFGGCWLRFNQFVSCAIVYTPTIIIWDPYSFWLCFGTQLVNGDLDPLSV